MKNKEYLIRDLQEIKHLINEREENCLEVLSKEVFF